MFNNINVSTQAPFRSYKNTYRGKAKGTVTRKKLRMGSLFHAYSVAAKAITFVAMPIAVASYFSMTIQTTPLPVTKGAKGDFSAPSQCTIKIGTVSIQDNNVVKKATIQESVSKPIVLDKKTHQLKSDQTVRKIPHVYALSKKLSTQELKERNNRHEFRARTQKDFKKSLDLSVPQAFLRAEKVTGFSANVLLTLSRFESWFGTDPNAKGSALQTTDYTQLEYFAKLGSTFVAKVMPHDPAKAKEIKKLLSYFDKKHDPKTGAPYYVFNDKQCKADHNGGYPIINGKPVTSVKDWIMSYKKDHFVTAVFTSLHLEKEAGRVVTKFLENEESEALAFFNEIGSARYRLIHYRGAKGTYRAITDCSLKGADIIRDPVERKGMNVAVGMNNKDTLKAIIGQYESAYEEVSYLNGMFKSQLRATKIPLFSPQANKAKLALN